MLEKLIESIYSRALIKLEIGKKYPSMSIKMDCSNKEILKDCLRNVEEYLRQNRGILVKQINEERRKLRYYTTRNGTETVNYISLNSYKSCPLLRLLTIREALIKQVIFIDIHARVVVNSSFFQLDSSFFQLNMDLDAVTDSWCRLNFNDSIKIKSFFGCPDGVGQYSLASAEEQMKKELSERLARRDTNYFAFGVSNGTFSEPYILKISQKKIQEVICSTSGHRSTHLHSHLWEFINNNNPALKVYPALPLKHDGNCTRYSDYALIQFLYRSERHGEEIAFTLLQKQTHTEQIQVFFVILLFFLIFLAMTFLKKKYIHYPQKLPSSLLLIRLMTCQLALLFYQPNPR